MPNAAVTPKHHQQSATSPGEKKALQSLEIFDQFNDQPTDGQSSGENKNDKYLQEKTPAWRTPNDIYQMQSTSSSQYDTHSFDAAKNDNNSSSTLLKDDELVNIYRVRLDNIEFDEQELFDNFKPIFDFNNPEPNYDQDSFYSSETSNNNNKNDYELYGINASINNLNADYHRFKAALGIDQASDLALP